MKTRPRTFFKVTVSAAGYTKDGRKFVLRKHDASRPGSADWVERPAAKRNGRRKSA